MGDEDAAAGNLRTGEHNPYIGLSIGNDRFLNLMQKRALYGSGQVAQPSRCCALARESWMTYRLLGSMQPLVLDLPAPWVARSHKNGKLFSLLYVHIEWTLNKCCVSTLVFNYFVRFLQRMMREVH